MKTQFVCFFWFIDFKSISFGASLWLRPINVEIHIPFGFIKIGLVPRPSHKPINYDEVSWRGFGLQERYEPEDI